MKPWHYTIERGAHGQTRPSRNHKPNAWARWATVKRVVDDLERVHREALAQPERYGADDLDREPVTLRIFRDHQTGSGKHKYHEVTIL